MRAEFAHEQAQTYLRQRNRFAVLAAVLGLTTLVSLGAAVTRDEQVVLVPITAERITVSSGGIDAPYLELVTRDTALMLLNRAPESLDYWMANILKLADPAAHGRLKAELVRIVEEQRGSDISQAFVIAEMHVDPTVLRGFPQGNSEAFKKRLAAIWSTRDAAGSLGIDPRLFRAFNIEAAPSFVMLSTEFSPCDGFDCTSEVPPHDRIAGNISVGEVLETFASGKGPGAELARLHLRQLSREERP